METFSALLALYDGKPPINGGFPPQKPVTQSSEIFFEPHLNGRWYKHSRKWAFETPLRWLWRHCNDLEYERDI